MKTAITYEELKTHSSYSDAWISVNGTVYDITLFLRNHPVGDTFRANLGTECGGIFSSAHAPHNIACWLKNEAFLIRNEIKIVGQLDISRDRLHRKNENAFLDRIVYRDTDTDALWQDLKSGIQHYLNETKEKTNYSLAEGIAFIAYYLSIYILLSYMAWFTGSILAAGLLGFHMVCTVAHISHMATHFGFTRSPTLNFVAFYFFDLSGTSGLEWQISHQTHHNQPHSSIDHQTSAFDNLGVRIHEYMQHRGFHRFQHLYYWMVILLYLPFRLVSTSVWLIINRQFIRHRHEAVTHIFARLAMFAQVVYCGYLHGRWVAIGLFMVYAASYSLCAFGLLFNNHEETHQPLGRNSDVSHFHNAFSWAEIQVRASSNWYPTNWILRFVEFHYGYFNYHIEHHLFPTFKPSLLKRISPIVASVCHKHNIPYISTSFMEVQRSMQAHLTKLARPDTID
jgi:linoleoyl-CoA desaturase